MRKIDINFEDAKHRQANSTTTYKIYSKKSLVSTVRTNLQFRA